MDGDTFQLFTSLRYDEALLVVPYSNMRYAGWNYRNESPLYMLDLHRDRMLRAATYWNWKKAVQVLEGESGLQTLSDFVVRFAGKKEDPLRVKVTITQEGELACEASPAPQLSLSTLLPSALPSPGTVTAEEGPSQLPVYEVLVDHHRISQSEFTHFKTTRRAMYDAARQRASIKLGEAKEVLMVNGDSGAVMEGSISTPYFWRNGKWVTPPVSSHVGAQNGSGGNDGTTRRWALER